MRACLHFSVALHDNAVAAHFLSLAGSELNAILCSGGKVAARRACGHIKTAKHDVGAAWRPVIGRYVVFSAYKSPACCGPVLLSAGVLVEVCSGAAKQKQCNKYC